MSILYKVQNSDHIKDCIVENKYGACRISTKNVVAFVFGEGTVFVCDIVTPWQFFKVTSSNRQVNVLEWNYTGEYLLIGYKSGIIEIWATRQKLINSWILLYKSNIPCEDIIGCKFFQNGKNIYFNSQKKDLLSYTEKFDRLDYRPTATGFGCTSVEGCLVVTSSGLLGAFIIPKLMNTGEMSSNFQPKELITVTHSLGLSRNYITLCSMSHSPNGCVNIAINCGWREKIIQFYKVSLNLDDYESMDIKCQSMSSVFLNSNETKRISQIVCSSINNEDMLYITYKGYDGSVLEQWCLMKKPQAVHKLLQKNKGDFIQCDSWEHTAKIHFPSEITHLCLSKMLSDSMYIYIILRDSVQVFEHTLGLKKGGLTIFDNLTDDRLCCKFAFADISSLNQILVVFDNYAQMYAIQAPSWQIEKGFKPNTVALQVSLLELSLITGVDASDLLLMNLMHLDMLIEKLTENFTRQSAYTRHFYYSNFLSLKSNMCRVQSKQQDFDNLILLHSISITFKGLLRPSDLSCQDKGPADNLAIILSEPVSDVDKVLFNLDAKDFTVEPLTLQSLQQLIQWVADLALNILKKLPDEVMKSKLSKKHGYDISRDAVAISSIRELLVMIRIWGLLNSQCLPIYMKSVDNVDILSILFRLLTRLAQNTNEPDELLLDECNLLSTQVLIPPRQTQNPTTLLNCHMSVMKPFPLTFTTAIEPSYLQDIQFEEVVFASSTKDGISNLHLGSRGSSVKKCIRCGFVISLHKTAKTSALKAWCNRWLYCHCGGHWKTI